MIIHTNKGRVWEVRKKGRLLWKVLGQFNKENAAVDCINGDLNGASADVEYVYIDRRTKKGFKVWVLEYTTFQGGEVHKIQEQFLTGLNARLHAWLYGFDRQKFNIQFREEERGE